MSQKLPKLLLLYLAFFSFLSPALSLYEGSESFTEDDPMKVLYTNVSQNYMQNVTTNLKNLLENYVFSDILQKPIEPYSDIKVNIQTIFDEIDTSKEKPFYDFYRELKMALSKSHDANLDIIGTTLPFGENIDFAEYRQCLPFKFYVDYNDTKEAKLFIKEYETCSKYYDNATKKFIKEHENIAIKDIKGKDPFDFLKNFGTEFYKFKNPESHFSIIIASIHENSLSFTPLSEETLKPFNLTFVDGQSLETKFTITTDPLKVQEKKEETNANITWNFHSKGGEVKCKVDLTNKLNVLYIKKFFIEEDTDSTLSKCAVLFQGFDHKLVIITSQLWKEENKNSFYYLQYLFPKITFKYNMAMKQTDYNKQLFEKDEDQFLNTETCEPFKDWDEFKWDYPDDYDGIKHSRTKPFYPFTEETIEEYNNIRKELMTKGNLKKSTDVLIFTDYVNFGPAGTFIKTIQNNGAAIIAGYAGNPHSNKTEIKTLDSGLDPVLNTNYEKISKEYDELRELGIDVYKIPYAEAFESANITGKYKYPMAFKVNKVDEMTNIYHFYDDIYYDEFINKAKEIFEKYNEKQECSKNNPNLVYEMNSCSFKDDSNAHGGYSCGDDGKWTKTCKKSYCNYGYFYSKSIDLCLIDTCVGDVLIEINEETEKTITIDPKKRYIIGLNTNLYTYFFKSTENRIIRYDDYKICSKFCVVKGKNNYMYINYERNLNSSTSVTIISKKVDLATIESYLLPSPKYSETRFMVTSAFIFQLTEDNYMYIASYDKSAQFYYALYDENMTPDDIINVNKKYFKEGLDQLMFLPKDKIYIGIFTQKSFGFAKIYFHNALPQTIDLQNGDKTILFLNKDTSYNLNFAGNKLPFMIRLNEKTNGFFLIDDDDTSTDPKNISLTDKYFTPSKQPYTGKIEINEIKPEKGEGILIEILYKFPDSFETITGEVTNKEITKLITLVQFSPPEADKKIMKIHIESENQFAPGFYGGPSKDNFFYYSISNEPKYILPITNYYITLDDPLKDVQKEDNEVYYISLKLASPVQGNKIHLTVKYESNPLEVLYETLDETYAKNIISNLTSIIEKYYIYDDIAKNPPKIEGLDNYHHPRVNFTKELNAIVTKDRKFYDFYREIRAIIAAPRDLHFNIFALTTPSGFKFYQMTACLPFSFYVDKEQNTSEFKVYIKYYSDCAPYFSEKIRKKVKEKEEKKIALEKINNKDPFDYIQEWGENYRRTKSPHGQFSNVKTQIHSFNLILFPFNQSELSMEFKFEKDTETLNLDYYILLPNIRSMNNLLGSNSLSQEEFDEFYKNEMRKNVENINMPNTFEIIRRYKKYKGLLLEQENESPIKWDYEFIDSSGKYLKCRVDKDNGLNVILQNNFLLDFQKTINVIDKCANLFHTNKNKVVVIQHHNGGGYIALSTYLHQLLQVKIQSRGPYAAYKNNDNTRKEYKEVPLKFINLETCKPYYDFNDFINGTTDEYDNDGVKILHEKSKFTDFGTKEFKIEVGKRRQELNATGNTKNPTDIIIFTDSYSYSATSLFIKGFQNEGGAIIVGYNGNPKLGKEVFDASQSPTSVLEFSHTKEYINLNKLGFRVAGISYIETFDEDYKKPNPIPREYKVDIIDERSNILEAYSDDTYQLFMDEAKKVFEKYNEKGECNPNNTLLLFNNESCTFSEDEHAHGGNPCGSDGTWNKTECRKYYCDYGFYYSKIEGKCIRDYCTNDPNEKEIILNGAYDQTITLNKNNNIEYVFRIKNEKYTYIFEASEPGYMLYEYNNPCPSLICSLQQNNEKIHLNYFRNITSDKDITIKITSFENFPGKYESLVVSDLKEEILEPLSQKMIFILEPKVNYITYPKVFDGKTKMYKAEYDNTKMKLEDIINISDKFFIEVKDEIIETPPGKIYILAIKTENPGALMDIYLQPQVDDTEIEISEEPTPKIMYFLKDKEYLIDFSANKYVRMIQLSKITIDSEITIKNLQSGEEAKLSANNAYYALGAGNTPFKNQLSIKVTKGNHAMIEFLFASSPNYEIITDKEFINHKLTKTTIINFDKNTKDSDISFTLSSLSQNPFGYTLIKYYSKNNYIPIPEEIEILNAPSTNYSFSIYNPKENLEKDESFSIIIFVSKASLINDEILLTKKEDIHYPISELYQEVTPDYMKDVLTNIKTLLGSFIFADILKEPPEPYENDTVDIISEFDKININQNRPFYEFYRDIKMTLSRTRDANLDILGGKVTFGKDTYDFDYYRMCLPFTFYLDNKNNTEVKMYIKEFEFCSKYFDSNVTKTIKELENVPLEKINGSDPFDFVNKFSEEFYNLKNRDAQFANMIDVIPDNTLIYQPLTPYQLNYIKLEFNNKKELVTHYHVIKEKVQNEEIKESQISWNITSKNGQIKCRVDTTNNLNVLFLGSLVVDDSNIINDCANLFYSNEYKIVIITSQLWEGDTHNAYLYSQMLFPKLNIKFNLAMKKGELNRQIYEEDKSLNFINPDTCRRFNTWEDLENNDFSEDKTNIYSPITEGEVLDLAVIRRKLINLKHLKKSTEILILTDTVNFGAASLFIKMIQRNGGAIIASYGGNPKLNKTQIAQLDASLDPAYSSIFEFSKEFKALKAKGFDIYGIPYAEAHYYYNTILSTATPMAFEVNKPDEMTNIYHFYDDNYYDEFINKAKEIFEKYKEKCNKDNSYLVYESDECKFSDNYTHGGYECGEDGKWKKNDTKSCRASYCDVGYSYYSGNMGECESDACFESKEITLTVDNNMTITISEGNNTRYVIRTETDDYIYFFEANEPGFIQYENQPCPSAICVLQKKINNKIFLNYNKEVPEDKNITIKISAVKSFNGYIQSLLLLGETNPLIESLPEKAIFIFESKVDYIYYEKTIENPPKIFSAKYDNKITLDDIVSINKDKFKEEKGPILESKENETFIIAFTTDNKRNLVELIAMPKKGQKETNINDDNRSPKIMYLSKEVKQYTLDFKQNTIERIIHLSKDKTGGEIGIKNEQTGKEVIINEKSPYYIFENTNAAFNGKLTLTVKNDNDAMIEFLFDPSSKFDIKTDKEIENLRLRNPVIINFEKNTKGVNINITLTSKDNFAYSNITYYSKKNYIPYNPNIDIPRTISGSNNYFFQIYNKNETSDEILGLLINIDPNDAIYLTKKEDIRKVDPTPTPTDKKEEDDGGLPGWAIALIVLGSIIVAVVIAIIVWKCLVSKDRVNSELIGSLTNPNQGKENELNVDQ